MHRKKWFDKNSPQHANETGTPEINDAGLTDAELSDAGQSAGQSLGQSSRKLPRTATVITVCALAVTATTAAGMVAAKDTTVAVSADGAELFSKQVDEQVVDYYQDVCQVVTTAGDARSTVARSILDRANDPYEQVATTGAASGGLNDPGVASAALSTATEQIETTLSVLSSRSAPQVAVVDQVDKQDYSAPASSFIHTVSDALQEVSATTSTTALTEPDREPASDSGRQSGDSESGHSESGGAERQDPGVVARVLGAADDLGAEVSEAFATFAHDAPIPTEATFTQLASTGQCAALITDPDSAGGPGGADDADGTGRVDAASVSLYTTHTALTEELSAGLAQLDEATAGQYASTGELAGALTEPVNTLHRIATGGAGDLNELAEDATGSTRTLAATQAGLFRELQDTAATLAGRIDEAEQLGSLATEDHVSAIADGIETLVGQVSGIQLGFAGEFSAPNKATADHLAELSDTTSQQHSAEPPVGEGS